MLSTDSQCPLLTLPDEIIIEILSYLAPEAILKVEDSCKRLYELCRSRAVWRTQMRRLDIGQAPSMLPYEKFETLSEQNLRMKVVRAVRQYWAWNHSGERPPLRAVDLPLPHIDEYKIVRSRLLPGGNEILVGNSGTVELWSVVSGECIWAVLPPEDHVDYVGFDFDLIEDGRVLLVATVCTDNVFPSLSLLRVHAFDFLTRTGEPVFERRLPCVSPSRIMFQGDIFIACISRSFQSVVVDWRTGNALILDFIDPTGLRIDARSKLIADNGLIVFMHHAQIGFCAVNLPLSALRGFWSDEADPNAWKHVPFRPEEQGYAIIPLPYLSCPSNAQREETGCGPWVLAHHVFKPNWKPDAPTEIFVVAYTVGPSKETPMRLVSFRLQLERSSSGKDSSRLALVNSSSAPVERLPRNPRNISNAGLMFTLRQHLQIFSLFTDDQQPINVVDLGEEIVPYDDLMDPNVSSVDPWTGAIAIRFPGKIKVLHFDV